MHRHAQLCLQRINCALPCERIIEPCICAMAYGFYPFIFAIKINKLTYDGNAGTSNSNNSSDVIGTTSVDGFYGKARSFNGTTDKVQMSAPLITGTGDFSISAWINPSSAQIGTYGYISGNYGLGNLGGIEWYLTNGNILRTYIGGS